MNRRAFITGVSGPQLNAAEREFVRAQQPWGFILFKRNIETPTQVITLVEELRRAIGDPEAPVLIDQEGGRVQRLGPPYWPVYPAGAVFGVLYDIDPGLGLAAARFSARLIAADLTDLGVTVDCLPLADVPVPGADAVVGNRAYGTRADKVAAIGRAVTEGLEQGGILPVLKHIPGHGRATADTHFRLPLVVTPKAEPERPAVDRVRARAEPDRLLERAGQERGWPRKLYRLKPDGRLNLRTARPPWLSMSRALRARSAFCWRWRGSRRSTSPRFRSWRWPTST